MTEVRAIGTWATNAHLIADVAMLGYLDGSVLDATFGEGAFWNCWRPEMLTASDLHKDPLHSGADWLYERYQWDYLALPCEAREYDAVMFDPPYKLSGTPALGEFDERYGIQRRTTRDEVLDDIVNGARECYRVARRFLLVKCQDQVEGGKVRWQTDLVTRAIEDLGGRKVTAFMFVSNGRPQPGGRRQLTPRQNYSSLLVFGRHPMASDDQATLL